MNYLTSQTLRPSWRKIRACVAWGALCFLTACQAIDTVKTNTTVQSFTPDSVLIDTVTSGQTSLTVTAPAKNLYTTVYFDLGDLVSDAICEGKTILGVKGLAQCSEPCPSDPFLSNRFHDKGVTPISQTLDSIGGVGTFASYRDIPAILKDDEGLYEGAAGDSNCSAKCSSSIVYSTTYASTNCGVSSSTMGTISQRVAACNSPWVGSDQANQGQAKWDLVTASSASVQVWRDQRTRLLWSSQLGVAANWCEASGNQEKDLYCSSNTKSACAEAPGLTAAFGADDFSLGTYGDRKGGMGLLTLDPLKVPTIRWRLPTLNDYKQAEVDGIRFVLPDMGKNAAGAGQQEWTSTIRSMSPVRTDAYVYQTDNGMISAANRGTTSTARVRCVGGVIDGN